jgi:hypothetical protein
MWNFDGSQIWIEFNSKMYKLEKFQKIDTSRVLHFKYISVNPTQNCQIVKNRMKLTRNYKLYISKFMINLII